MLQDRKEAYFDASPVSGADVSPKELLVSILGFVRRRYKIALLIALLVIALGVIILATSAPQYTGRATLMLDSRKVQLFQQQSLLADPMMDNAQIESQVEVLRSQNLALAVIKELKLANDPELASKSGGILSTVFSIFGKLLDFSFGHGAADTPATEPVSDLAPLRSAVATLQDRLTVKRVGLTYVIEISYRSFDPVRAAQIANAVAESYIMDQLEARYQTTKRAGVWLKERINELGSEAAAAERTVLEFKTKNNIVDTGGRLINEQQLAELNSQLITARSSTAETKARLEQIQNVLKVGTSDVELGKSLRTPDAAVSDALKNDVINKLRQEYLDLANKEGDFSRRFGMAHMAVLNLRSRMSEIRRSIYDELRRIGEAYKSDYDIAKLRQESLEASLAASVSQSQTTNQAQVALRELESSAQTYRALYDNFQQRYMESIQQQSFPISEARLITRASSPVPKSGPNARAVIGVSVAAGIFLGFGIAFMIEMLDRGLRTTSQVENDLNAECIAMVPLIKEAKGVSRWWPISGGPPSGSTSRSSLDYMYQAANAPLSQFAEAIRSIKVSADLKGGGKKCRVLGFTSTFPNEGKSTVASNFAHLIAHSGRNVLLIDCDLRNPSLSKALRPRAEMGLVEVLGETTVFDEAIWTDPATNLKFLPLAASKRISHSNEILSSAAMAKFIKSLRTQFDYIVVDFPPMAPVVDVRATTLFVDSYVYVVEWARTPLDMVQRAFRSAPPVCDKMLGVVLNKVDLDVVAKYEQYGGSYYHTGRYDDGYRSET